VPADFDVPLPEDILNAFEGAGNSCSIPTFSSGSSVGMPDDPETGGSIFVLAIMRYTVE
jgi:hypothetical protein